MATKLTGRLFLGKIPKEAIQTANDGGKFIYVDVLERRAPGKYGETHTITMYDKNTRQTVYLADLKPVEFGVQQEAPAPANNYRQPAPAPAPAPAQPVSPSGAKNDEDLPF